MEGKERNEATYLCVSWYDLESRPKRLNEHEWNDISNTSIHKTRDALSSLSSARSPQDPPLHPDDRLAREIACIPSQVKASRRREDGW